MSAQNLPNAQCRGHANGVRNDIVKPVSYKQKPGDSIERHFYFFLKD